MIKIIVDAMGGDNAPAAVVNGCIEALAKKDGFCILLVGDEEKVTKILKEREYNGKRIKIVHAPGVITNHDEPSKVVKQKKDSSMVVAFNLLKEKKGDVLISCGSTGALLACSILLLKRIKGINRPALGTLIPSKKGSVLLMDAGLNAECKPVNLLQFAIMGSCYIKHLTGNKYPKVGLLNIGAEKEKGNELVKEAYELIQSSEVTFIGNVEGNEIIAGNADVVVCDGFTGNVVLKAIEGVAGFFIGELKEIFLKSITTKLSALFVKDGIKKLKNKVDVDVMGGAPILGIDGLAIKSHGNSNAITIENVIIRAAVLAECDFLENMKREIDRKR